VEVGIGVAVGGTAVGDAVGGSIVETTTVGRSELPSPPVSQAAINSTDSITTNVSVPYLPQLKTVAAIGIAAAAETKTLPLVFSMK
jgi:hypothetical protein